MHPKIILQTTTIYILLILFLKVGKDLKFYSSHLKFLFVLVPNSLFLGQIAWYYYWVTGGAKNSEIQTITKR